LNRFGYCHAGTMPQKESLVTPEKALTDRESLQIFLKNIMFKSAERGRMWPLR
jgi:hypothetical protein